MNLEPTRSLVLGAAVLLASTALVTVSGPGAAVPTSPTSPIEQRVNTTVEGDQSQPAVATAPDGDYVVTWFSHGTDGSFAIRAQRFTAAGVAQGNEVQVSEGVPYGDPSIAMNAEGTYVIAWSAAGDGFTKVAFRRFAADGTPQGGEMQADTNAIYGDHAEPHVAMDADGDFVIAWYFSSYLGDSAVRARRYSADGTPEGPDYYVTTFASSGNSIAMDTAGNHVVVWADFDNIYGRRYDANGAVGPTFPVNTTTADNQGEPSVAMDAGGDFVVTWTSYLQDGSAHGIYAQRFHASGSPRGPEFRVNTTTPGDQYQPSVASDVDGDLVVSWASNAPDGTVGDVFTQRYDAAGAPRGLEVRVNSTVTDDQRAPAVATDPDGDTVVVWASQGQDGDGSGIYARRLRGPEQVDLRLSQSVNADPVTANGRLIYRLRVHNSNEPSAETGIALIDAEIGAAAGVRVVTTPPDGAVLSSADGTGWICGTPTTTLLCRLTTDVPAGTVAPTLVLRYAAPESAGTAQQLAEVTDRHLDPDRADNLQVERTTVACLVQLTQSAVTSTEAGPVTATVTRSGTDCGASSVAYATGSISATAGQDYTAAGGSLSWADGEVTKTITVPITDDGLDERNEQLTIRLSDVTGALLGRSTTTATITDDDDPARIRFTATGATLAEPGGYVDLTVLLSEVSGQDVSVNLAKGGTATWLADYLAPRRVTIPAGQRNVTFEVEILDDALDEPNEVAFLTLGSPTGATVGTQKTFRLDITDND